ncbi:MAG TPA: cytochrome c [Caldimonas sp.]|nr:cytochrome c [Caldimonas sp.]
MTSRRIALTLLALLALGVAAVATMIALNHRDEQAAAGGPVTSNDASIARGLYLTRAGDCIGCHTARGGTPYAGGRGIETPFGTVYAPNLTPDRDTGLGEWSADDFWRALHNGRARDGRLLYPAFPYPNYTRVTRADADAMYVYLRSLPAVRQVNRAHELRFPFDLQPALAVWRALFFEPGAYRADAARDASWNRGAYLVEGLGHCNACHSKRNALGAPSGPLDLAGGLIPVQNWYAPSLTAADESSVVGWDVADVVALLRDGRSPRGTVMGPMSEVVLNSTQHLSNDDLVAIARFLQSLPATPPSARSSAGSKAATADAAARGARLYADRCAACHGERGEGVPGAYPALAGSRAVTMDSSANLVHIVLEGGFPPSTTGNPRPFGMPPFATFLSNDDVSDLLSHIRRAWGNRAAPVSPLEVARYRDTGRP